MIKWRYEEAICVSVICRAKGCFGRAIPENQRAQSAYPGPNGAVVGRETADRRRDCGDCSREFGDRFEMAPSVSFRGGRGIEGRAPFRASLVGHPRISEAITGSGAQATAELECRVFDVDSPTRGRFYGRRNRDPPFYGNHPSRTGQGRHRV